MISEMMSVKVIRRAAAHWTLACKEEEARRPAGPVRWKGGGAASHGVPYGLDGRTPHGTLSGRREDERSTGPRPAKGRRSGVSRGPIQGLEERTGAHGPWPGYPQDQQKQAPAGVREEERRPNGPVW